MAVVCERLETAGWQGIDAWWVDLSPEPEEGDLACLSGEEHGRAGRFVFERDRRRYRAAHVALRQLLAMRLGVSASAPAYVVGEDGKPALAGRPACAFNLSHSGDVAVVGLSADGEIGVDVEVLRPMSDARALAERNFTPAERASLDEAGEAGRDLRFLLGWTRKEACLKALGCGLRVAPDAFETGLTTAARRVDIPTGDATATVEVASFIHPRAGVVALARLTGRS